MQALVQSQHLNPSKTIGSTISQSNSVSFPLSSQHLPGLFFKKLVCPFAVHLQEKFSPFSLLTFVQTEIISWEKHQYCLFTNLRVTLSSV